jgi:hypothetical protein
MAALGLMAAVALCACEKPVINEDAETTNVSEAVVNGDIRVKLHVSQFEQLPIDNNSTATRTTEVASLCKRISYGVSQNGAKLDVRHQVSSDENFGEMTLFLSEGSYQIVVVAHNGSENAQMSDPTGITFKEDGKLRVTDTFYYYGTIDVNQNQEVSIGLKRAVAMVRIVTQDTIPSGVQQMRLYYTGGSSTFDATTGLGCVKSNQAEYREVTAEMIGQPGTFDFYTFPRAEEGTLNMKLTAYKANMDVVKEKEFNDVPIRRNQMTRYTGFFFTDGEEDNNNEHGDSPDENGNLTFKLTIDNAEWNQLDFKF